MKKKKLKKRIKELEGEISGLYSKVHILEHPPVLCGDDFIKLQNEFKAKFEPTWAETSKAVDEAWKKRNALLISAAERLNHGEISTHQYLDIVSGKVIPE